LAAFLALLVTLTRWPAVHLLPADSFYQALTAHGLEHADLSGSSSRDRGVVLLLVDVARCRLATPRWAWLGFALMLIGSVTTNVAILRGARA